MAGPIGSPLPDEGVPARTTSEDSVSGEPLPVSGRRVLRVIVADDHAIVRKGVARLLAEVDLATTVAMAGTAEETVAAVLAHDAEVLVLDLAMPGSSLATIETLHALRPGLRILVYSMHDEREWAVRALEAGAAGYVSKSAPVEAIVDGVRAVAAGRHHVGPEVAQQLIERALGGGGPGELPHQRLSNREFEVFERLARGESATEIGETLGLSPKTVSSYRARILAKLGVERNADLTRYAIHHGLLDD
jgi:DNA-binding NarL/FixJ family response regulator